VAELTFLIERAVAITIVIAPVAILVLILSGVVARLFGDAIPVRSHAFDPHHVSEEDPPPRWHPELAGRHRRATYDRPRARRNGGQVR
jgi:hypothetical protein